MAKITRENALQELLIRVPEFKDSQNFEEYILVETTIVFDHFGDFVLEKIEAGEDSIIKKCFDFINEMQESEDRHVQNLPVVGVFEVLVSSKKGIEVAEKLLNEKGMEWFLKIKNFNH